MAHARHRARIPPSALKHDTYTKVRPSSSTSAKAWLLGALLIQSCVQSLAARMSRAAAELRDQTGGCGALVAGSVVIIEVIKATLCFVLLGLLEVRRGPMATLRELARQTHANAKDALLILIPAVCYVISNTLNLHAAAYVEGPLLLVFGTSQILFVSLFSVALLRTRLSSQQWLALLILTAAVLCVQIDQVRDGRSKHAGLGLVLAAFACAISAFAGVFFELVLNHSAISLWVRNFHLAVLSLPLALSNLALHRHKLHRCGFFAGYGPSEWTFVFAKAIGGLIVVRITHFLSSASNVLLSPSSRRPSSSTPTTFLSASRQRARSSSLVSLPRTMTLSSLLVSLLEPSGSFSPFSSMATLFLTDCRIFAQSTCALRCPSVQRKGKHNRRNDKVTLQSVLKGTLSLADL